MSDQAKNSRVVIRQVENDEQLAAVRRLFLEYAQSLDFSLCFQDFDKELKDLPGEYAPPDGCLLLAAREDSPIGCVAVRRFDTESCEMKRLYVKTEARGTGVGRNLAMRAIDIAKQRPYSCMKLDTVSSMAEAIALYESLGFQRIDAYRHNPVPGAVFMELEL